MWEGEVVNMVKTECVICTQLLISSVVVRGGGL